MLRTWSDSGAYTSLALGQVLGLSKLLRTMEGQGVSPSSPREWGPCGRLSVELPCPVLSPGPAPSGLGSRGGESKDLGTDASPLAPSSLPSRSLQLALQAHSSYPKKWGDSVPGRGL